MLGLLGAVDLFWQELLPQVVRPRCWQNSCPCQMLGAGRRNSGGTSLGGVFTAANTAVGTAFFEVGAVSFVLFRFRLRTSLKSSSWVAADFGVLDWPAGVLAFSTAFNSCRATVYVCTCHTGH
jgi:hypothetical protein